MKKLAGRKLAVWASFFFAVAFSFGASAINYPVVYTPPPFPGNPQQFPTPPGTIVENGPCVACHQACETARQSCFANGGVACFPNFNVCTQSCSVSVPGCNIP